MKFFATSIILAATASTAFAGVATPNGASSAVSHATSASHSNTAHSSGVAMPSGKIDSPAHGKNSTLDQPQKCKVEVKKVVQLKVDQEQNEQLKAQFQTCQQLLHDALDDLTSETLQQIQASDKASSGSAKPTDHKSTGVPKPATTTDKADPKATTTDKADPKTTSTHIGTTDN